MADDNAAVVIDNLALLGTVAASSAAAGMAASQLLNPHPSEPWRALTNIAWFVVDLGSIKIIDTIMLTHSCGPLSELRVRISEMDGTALDSSGGDSGPIVSGMPGFEPADTSADGKIVYLLPAPVSARYVRIDLSDPAAVFVQGGCVVVGRREQFAYTFSIGSSVVWIDRSTVDQTGSGQTLIWQRGKFRRLKLPFNWATTDQRYGVWERMARVNGITKNVLLILDTTSSRLAIDTFFGRVTVPPEFSYLQAVGVFGTQIQMDERERS